MTLNFLSRPIVAGSVVCLSILRCTMNLVEQNKERDLWFTDGYNCILIPQGWCDAFTMANGFTGGPDNDEDGPELFGYGPVDDTPNTKDCEAMFFNLEFLNVMRQTTEEEAKRIHLALFLYLEQISKELS